MMKSDNTNSAVARGTFLALFCLKSLYYPVRAHSEAGLKLDNKLFNTTEDFALLFLTKELYEADKNNLDAVKNQAFTSCYAFYNANGENTIVHRISSKIGGDATVIFRNNTDFTIEVRVDSPDGEVLGYIAARNVNAILNVEADKDMTLFPVFKRYSPKKNELYTINPRTPDGNPISTDWAFKKGSPTVVDVGALWKNIDLSSLTTGGCYVTLVNGVTTTGIRLVINGKEVVTSTGVRTVNRGETETYFIPFPKVADQYPKKLTLKLGVRTAASDPVYAEEFEFERDYAYIFTATGNSHDRITVSKVKPLDEKNNKPIDVQKALFVPQEGEN